LTLVKILITFSSTKKGVCASHNFTFLSIAIKRGNKMKGITFFLLLVSFSALHSQPVTLRDTTNQYDYIIITVPEFVNACEPFRQHKETVRDFRTLIVDTTQIYAEFDSSAAPQDNIRDFISYAGTFWKEPRPKYFMLVGDLTNVPSFPDIFNFAGYLDTAYTDFKYSVNKFSSDTLISTFQIGRVPAKYEFEIQNYTTKVINYETDTSYSNWMNNNFVVKQAFPDSPRVQIYNNIANHLLSNYPGHFDNYLYTENDTLPHGTDRDSIINFLNTTGANSLWLIGDFKPLQFGFFSLLDTADISLFDNGLKYFITFCFAQQSFTFESNTNSLANNLLLDDDAAISVIAPVGLVFVSQNASWLYKVSTEMFGVERKSLGSALNESRNSFPISYTIRMLNLWGDPSIYPKYDIPASVDFGEDYPTSFTLYQNYPNPFNPSTTIKFALPVNSRVKINVYNTVGQLVETLVDKEMESGYHEVNFNAARLASGVYLYQLQSSDYVSVKKMLLLK
jgi:hypothetical protein